MESKIYFSFNQFLFVILFLLLIYKISSLYFAYPTAITLKNGNIFIVHQDGITICDANFTKIIKNVTTFSSNKLNNEGDLYKVTIDQFEDGYIACIIFNRIFIIDNNGELKFNESLTNNNNLYLSLALEKVSGKNYYYLIGYIYQNSLYLKYYTYNSLYKTNQNNIQYPNFRPENNNNKIQNTGLTCQFLYYSNINYIACFYYIYYDNFYHDLFVSTFYINFNTINLYYNTLLNVLAPITFFKSTVSSDHSKAIVAFYQTNGREQTFIYSINSLINIAYTPSCNYNKFSTMEVNYIQDINRNEFIFTCITNEGNSIYAAFYDKYTEYITNTFTRTLKCNNFNQHSLLYLKNKNNYFLLTDLICENKINSFKKLIIGINDKEEEDELINDDTDAPTDIKKEKEEEDEEIEEETEEEEEKEEKEEEKEEKEEEKEEKEEEEKSQKKNLVEKLKKNVNK